MARGSSLVFVCVWLPFAIGCGGASPGDLTAPLRLDPCEPITLALDEGATPVEASGAAAAIDLWNARAGSRLSMPRGNMNTSEGVTLPLRFEAAAAPSHGFFDPQTGVIAINADLADHPLAVVIAHEVGHAFGLAHVAGRASVMNAGNLDVEPTAEDVDALVDLWGRCATRVVVDPPL